MLHSFRTTLLFVLLSIQVSSQDDHTMHHQDKLDNDMQHDSHLITSGPIGVMGDHMHHKGTFMFSYRYMKMNMSGMYANSSIVGESEVLTDFVIVPSTMSMSMHMLGGMYAVSNDVTIMAMANYSTNDMSLKMRSGTEFETESNGFGDLKLAILAKLFAKDNYTSHLTIGTSIPTGNLEKRDQTPMSENALLAYPMQLGSGTWDPFVGFTIAGIESSLIWGVQSQFQYRISKNDMEYALGNQFIMTSWLGYKTSEHLNFTLRASFEDHGSISGSNPEMNPMMMPLFNTENSGQRRVNLYAGTNWLINDGPFKGTRIGIEGGQTVYQNVDGIQMNQGFQFTTGIQFVFGSSH